MSDRLIRPHIPTLPKAELPLTFEGGDSPAQKLGKTIDFVRSGLSGWSALPGQRRIGEMLGKVTVLPHRSIAQIMHTDPETQFSGAYIYPYVPTYGDQILLSEERLPTSDPGAMVDILTEELAHSYYITSSMSLSHPDIPHTGISAFNALGIPESEISQATCRSYGFVTYFDVKKDTEGNEIIYSLRNTGGMEEYRAGLVKYLFQIKMLQSTQFKGKSRPDGLLTATGAMLARTQSSGVLTGSSVSPYERQIAKAGLFLGALLSHRGQMTGKGVETEIPTLLKHLYTDNVIAFESYVKSYRNSELYGVYLRGLSGEGDYYGNVYTQ